MDHYDGSIVSDIVIVIIGGGVIDLMNRRLQQRLTEPEILKIFSDVAEALAYMHYCNPPVLHRDLKVENILILNQDHYKLCDFGSASLSKGNYIPTSLRDVQKLEDDIQRHTTLQYRAPEMVDVYQKKPVNEKADIWAMGVLLYKLCYYTTPFEEEGQLAILNARYTIPTSPVFSDGLRRLIMSMLQEDQHRRPNIYQVLQAVCQLRGMECPIRDIYSEPIVTPASFSSPSDNPSIFEKIPMPAQEVPTITPMRRGRPTKPENREAYDPFDPSHVSKHHPSSPPPLPNHGSPTFQNSFQPESPPTRVQSAPLTHHTTPKPQMATKILQTQPLARDEPVQEDEVEVKDETMPRINRNVSSSIEARFNAIKNASRNTPIHPIPTVSTSTGKKNKPAPPPKPARFRTHQRTVSSSTATEEPLSASSVDEFEHKFPSLEDLDKTI
ncbi:kinase-like domain-containing protein [Choanephora cucurbitarum]|nr:kinase-like domain-containing protein [Choanephora cucurbitarum]